MTVKIIFVCQFVLWLSSAAGNQSDSAGVWFLSHIETFVTK